MQYKLVFDAVDAGYRNWTFPAFGLIFVAFGVLLVASRKSALLSKKPAWFPYALLGFAVFWVVIAFTATYRDYERVKSAHPEVVEGVVTDFVPMPYTGHAMESFCVKDRCFSYSDYVVTAGFNNTSSHGGPIREGLPVRVTFVGNEIVRLEVAKDMPAP